MRRSWREIAFQTSGCARFDLAGDETVLGAQEAAHQRRRARIGGEPARGIAGRDRVQIGSEQRARSACNAGAQEPFDAVAPFSAAGGFGSGEIIKTRSGMGVDHPIGRRFPAEMDQEAGQHRMLDDVGKIPGVKGMTVVHRAGIGRAASAAAELPAFDKILSAYFLNWSQVTTKVYATDKGDA